MVMLIELLPDVLSYKITMECRLLKNNESVT